MLTRIISALALPGILLALTGCGSSTTPAADPPVPPPSSPSPPSHPHRESPGHFIRRWTDVEKQMENTGDTRHYLTLSRSCTACTTLATQIRSFYAAGGYVHWGGWKILSIEVNSRKGRGTTYAVRNRSLPTTYRKTAHSAVQHLPGGVTTELLQLERAGHGWSLAGKAELAS